MTKMVHTVFLVHGVGEHPDGWSQALQEQLAKTFAAIPSQSGDTLSDFITLKEIAYDKLFENVRARWSNAAKELGPVVDSLDMTGSLFGALTNVLSGLGTDNNFYTTYLLDAFLYRFTPVWGWVQAELATQFLDTLTPETLQNNNWSVIAHSLGTLVTHDTLHAMFTQTFKDSAGKSYQLNPLNHGPRVIAMIANVSDLLRAPNLSPYASLVRPMNTATGHGITPNFFNAWHRYDPVARLRQFNPVTPWYGASANAAPGYHDIGIDAVYRGNVHDLGHYLSDPQLYYPLLKTLSGGIISLGEYNKLVSNYHDHALFDQLEKAQNTFGNFAATLSRAEHGELAFSSIAGAISTLGSDLTGISADVKTILNAIKVDFQSLGG
jgi:hypothetical protein